MARIWHDLHGNAVVAADTAAISWETLHGTRAVEVAGSAVLLNIAGAKTASLSGTVTASGDLQFTVPFDLAGSRTVSLSGVASATGDVQSSTVVLLDISAQPILLSGTFSASGDLDPYPSLDLAGARSVAVSGAITVVGDLQAVAPFELGGAASAALSGAIGVGGDLQFLASPVDESPTGAGEENFGPIGRGSIVHRIVARRRLVAAAVRPVVSMPAAHPAQQAVARPVSVPAVYAARALRSPGARPRGLLLTRTAQPAPMRANFCSNCGAPLPH